MVTWCIHPSRLVSAEYAWRIRELFVVRERRSTLMSCQWLPLESFLSGASSAVVFFWGSAPPIEVFSWKTHPGKFFPGVLVLEFSNSVFRFLFKGFRILVIFSCWLHLNGFLLRGSGLPFWNCSWATPLDWFSPTGFLWGVFA